MGLLARVRHYQLRKDNKSQSLSAGSGLLARAKQYQQRPPEVPSSIPGTETIDDDLFVEVDFSSAPKTLGRMGDILSEDAHVLARAIEEDESAIPADDYLTQPDTPPPVFSPPIPPDYSGSGQAEASTESTATAAPPAADYAAASQSAEPFSAADRSPVDESNADIESGSSADFQPRPVQILPQLLAGIGSIGRGIDAPYLVFGILSDLLGLHGAALLLPDHADDTLVLFSSRGYDFDSMSRLRITADALIDLQKRGVVDDPRELELWKPYFSIREARNLKRILIVPLGSPKEGIVIVTGSKILDLPEETLLLLSGTLSDALGKMIHNSRARLLQNISPLFIVSAQEFPRYITEAQERQSSLLLGLPKVQINSMIESASPGVWRKSLERDCLRILGSIVQDDGAVSMDGDYYYILFSDIGNLDVQLIQEQLEFSLRQGFSSHLPGLDFIEFSHAEMKDIARRFQNAP